MSNKKELREQRKNEKKQKVNVNRGNSPFGYFWKRKMMKFYNYIFSSIWSIITTVGLVLFLLWFTSGAINQVKTGQTLVEWTTELGKEIGATINWFFLGDGPLEINEDGIYQKGKKPPKDSAIDKDNLPVPDLNKDGITKENNDSTINYHGQSKEETEDEDESKE